MYTIKEMSTLLNVEYARCLYQIRKRNIKSSKKEGWKPYYSEDVLETLKGVFHLPDKFYSAKLIALLLQISQSALISYVYRNRILPVYSIGGRKYYSEDQLNTIKAHFKS